MPGNETHVIQVTNVSPAVTKDQLKSFFSFIGKVEDIKLYPEVEEIDVSTRVCYVKYKDSEDVDVSLHLTNTPFVDRALIVVAVADDKIPDELTALGIGNSDGLTTSNMYQGLTHYPVLPSNTDLSRVEEIRRTIYVSNIECSLRPEDLMQFFTQAGEIKYMRMAGEESLALRSAFIEYTDQNSVIKALGLNGQSLLGHQICVTPSNTAIVKPQVTSGLSATSKEIEEAMKKVSEAESLISAVADPVTNGRDRSSHRSRSRRTRSRRRSRSRGSPRRRSRSRGSPRRRSRSRHRSRSRRRSRKSRSRSKGSKSRYSRSRSRDRKRDKEKSSRLKSSRDEKKSGDRKSRKSEHGKDASSKLEGEGSRRSEGRSRSVKKKSSKRKSGSKSRCSPSRSESRKNKKSRRHDDDKSSKEEKDSKKRKSETVSEKSSGKNSSSKRKNKNEEKVSLEKSSEPNGNQKTSGDDEGGKNTVKIDSNCSQLDMDVDSD